MMVIHGWMMVIHGGTDTSPLVGYRQRIDALEFEVRSGALVLSMQTKHG